VTFDCPRCHRPADEEHYGPCGSCRDELRTAMRRDAVEVTVEAFEPKMNVVPNAVATKE
jgi:hypothetical protein